MTQTNKSSKSASSKAGDGVTLPRSGVTGIAKDNMAIDTSSTPKYNKPGTTTVPYDNKMEVDLPDKVDTKKSASKAGKKPAKNNQGTKKPKTNNVKEGGEMLKIIRQKHIQQTKQKDKANTPCTRY